jgi:hypothetical protein
MLPPEAELSKVPIPPTMLTMEGLFGKWRIEVDGRGMKGILGKF